MLIRRDDPARAPIAELLAEHLREMRRISPPESVHALDLDGLRAPDVVFWAAWERDELLGCAALKALGPTRGEVKSMRTVSARRRGGVASALLGRLEREARRRGYQSLLLETGVQPEFGPARAFYERHGFAYRGPFADYREDPNSVFMVKRLR